MRGNTNRLRERKRSNHRADKRDSYSNFRQHGGSASSVATASSDFLVTRQSHQALGDCLCLIFNAVEVRRRIAGAVENIDAEFSVLRYCRSQAGVDDVVESAAPEQAPGDR